MACTPESSLPDALRQPWVGAEFQLAWGFAPPQAVNRKTQSILAVASGGGHWIELLRLRPALANHHVAYVTVRADYQVDVQGCPFHRVNDATGWNYLGSLQLLLHMAFIVLKLRPDVVISTGAAPGYFAIRLGKLLGARTIWVDSLANVEELSRAGRLAGPHADLWLTQWPALATEQGPKFAGQVL